MSSTPGPKISLPCKSSRLMPKMEIGPNETTMDTLTSRPVSLPTSAIKDKSEQILAVTDSAKVEKVNELTVIEDKENEPP